MKISTIIIVLFLAMAVITGIYTFANDLSAPTAFDGSINQTYLASFNKTAELQKNMSDQYKNIQNLSANTESAFQIITLVPEALIIAKNTIVYPFSVTGEFLNNMVEFLELPDWIYNLVLGVFVVLMIFGFIALILRFRS